MRTTIATLAVLVALSVEPRAAEGGEGAGAGAGASTPTANRMVAGDLGFTCDIPVDAESEAPNYQVAMFFLPAADGFAANVNIQRQHFLGDLAAYDRLSTGQFQKLGFAMVGREVGEDSVVYEYTGEMKGKALHWYARAFKRGDHVYLVTATALAASWEAQRERLVGSVDSFRLRDPADAGAETAAPPQP